MKSRLAPIASLLSALLFASSAAADNVPANDNRQLLDEAEAQFFQALNEKPKQGKTALEGLTLAYAVAPTDGRTNLLLGLNHLWLAAEATRQNPMTLQHVILADYFLGRAEKITGDNRIPSWRTPIQMTLAQRDGDEKTAQQHYADFLQAYKKNPDFHSFMVAMLAFNEPVQSAEFQRGLKVLRDTEACGEHNPSCQNQSRWPHNIEAFTVFAADYEAKAGNREAAQVLLAEAERVATETSWAYLPAIAARKQNLADRMVRYANADHKDDAAGLFDEYRSETCQLCHRK